MEYIIRKREIKDCKRLARVVTLAWNETYKGLVPDWFLEELKQNEEERYKYYVDHFNDNNQLVLEVDNEVVGFVSYGEAHDEYINCGEVVALYILKEYQGYGYGKELVECAKEELKKMGFDKMIIACLKGNPSNEFYKHIGGKYVKDGLYKRLQLEENIYLYENI